MVVRHGTRWRIGNGFDISMIDEPWIGMELRVPPAAPGCFVSSKLFGTAQQILDTPLFPQLNEDKMVWKPEKNEQYSVRSTYRIFVEEIVDVSHLHRNGFSGGIWNLKVPPKAKNMSRGVNCLSSCVFCHDPHADCYHLFFRCCTAVGIWRSKGLWQVIEPLLHRFDDASEIIFYLLEHGTAVQYELVTIMWSIWKSRNNKLWQQVTESNGNIIERAKHLLEDWRNANKKQQAQAYQQGNAAAVMQPIIQQVTAGRIEENRWKKPRRGRLKCNVDASFSSSTNKVGVVDIGEALVLHHAIRWVHELQLQNVDFEVDSKRVADYFNQGNGDVTEFGIIMDSNRHYCSLFLPNSRVEFSRRQANRVPYI
ncbi:hypothetical protein MTR_8g028785 [Medicago truncatula]|uniref:RNase H type-1 domain-containing protein n=1 Tax=Medicago truncatula TaxID=3880 RepID=A0A072TN42_MEDTR|nr:hypothetical protein MTR_8g028785 [Medicago truncatula]